jgi:hypothetical protein
MTRHRVLIAVAVFFAAAPARAQDATMSNEMRAEYLFHRGEKKFDSGKYAEACADFAESLKLGPRLGTLLNLALCHETTGKLATAWKEFHHAAAWASQKSEKERHDFAMQHVVSLEPRLPRAVFQLPAGTPITSLDVDGEPLPESQWYLPLYLDPGEHALGCSAPGKRRTSLSFRVVPSAVDQIVVIPPLVDEAVPYVPPKPPPPPPPADPDEGRRFGGWIAIGVGAIGVGLGTTFGALAIGARDDIGTHCAGNNCDAIGAQRFRDAQDLATVSTVAFTVGLLAVATGAYFVLSSRSPGTKP